ncbi:hypothetical protein WDU94_005977 [Cyamophila willieti]
MDSHFTNNFNAGSFQNIYNPQVESQHETKDYPAAMDQQQQNQNQNFNTLVYQQPNAFNAMDNNNLYSDLDAIDETPLVDNNITGMELYDTDPLDNSMINQDQNLFQPTPNMQPNMFGGYDEPKLAHFNTNIVMQDPMNSLHSGVQVHSNVIQAPSNVIQHSNHVIQPPQQQSQSNVIQPNPNSNMNLHSSVNTTPQTPHIDPMPTRSFYQNNYNPTGQTFTPVSSNVVPPSNQIVDKPGETLPVGPNLQETTHVANTHVSATNVTNNLSGTTNGAVQNAVSATTEHMDDDPMADEQEVASVAEDGAETNGHDPLDTKDASTEQPTTNGVTSEDGEKGDEEKKEEKKEELEKCVREGCENVAIVNTEWEDEYCSNECCIKHCTSVFNAWVQENLKAGGGGQNAGNTMM